MADTAAPPAPPKRWIIVKFWEHAVERAEHEIAELKAQGLFVRDATSQDKTADGSPVPPAPAAATGTAVTAPDGKPGTKPDA